MKITGRESSILAFLAQNASSFDKFKTILGSDALAIAKYLTGADTQPSDDVRNTGDAIFEWVRERKARELYLLKELEEK
jgi:hypothetical protein